MSITARKLKSGKTVYDVRYYVGTKENGEPNRVTVRCRTKTEAKLEESKLIAQADVLKGKKVNMTLKRFIDAYYWPNALKRLAPSTLDMYRREIDNRIIPVIGSLQLREIDKMRIQAMIDRIETKRAAFNCLKALRVILSDAVSYEIIQTNPAKLKYTLPPDSLKRRTSLVLSTFNEIGAYLNSASLNGSQRLESICLLGFYNGLRPEERYCLKWSDCDLEQRTITINSAYTHATIKHGGRTEKQPKTGASRRTIPMHPRVYRWMLQADKSTAYVTGDNKPLASSTINHAWSVCVKKSGIELVSIENMRHSFATAYLHAGGHVEDLARILGHADINTTYRRYVRPSYDDLARGMAQVSADVPLLK